MNGLESVFCLCYNLAKLIIIRFSWKKEATGFEAICEKIWSRMAPFLCFYLSRLVFHLEETTKPPYNIIHIALDDSIPFVEAFIIPYLLWFPYVAVTVAYFFFTSKNDYYRLCAFLFTGMTISLLVCTLFPNGTNFRPHMTRIKIFSACWFQALESGYLYQCIPQHPV